MADLLLCRVLVGGHEDELLAESAVAEVKKMLGKGEQGFTTLLTFMEVATGKLNFISCTGIIVPLSLPAYI